MTSQNTPPREKNRFDMRFFVLTLVVFAALGFFWSDYYGIRHGILGLLVWVVIFLMTFMFGVAYNALFILSADIDNWYEEGFRLILENFFSGGGVDHRMSRAYEGVPPSIDVMGAGVLDSHIVLALGRGPLFSRAVGPGYVKMEAGEHIKHIIDLRDHVRRTELKAVTRDGIPMESTMTVRFHVRRLPPEDANTDDPYHHDPQAIFQVFYFSSYGEGENEIPWTDRIAPLAAAELVAELGNYTLDEVYTLNNTRGPHPLDIERVKRQVREALNQQLEPNGITVASIDVDNFVLPEEVQQQRIINWQSRWQKQALVEMARGDAAAVEQIQQAQMQVEIALIRQIIDSIEQMKWPHHDLTDVVTLAAVEELESAASDVHSLMPPHMMNTLSEWEMMVAPPQLPEPERGSTEQERGR